MTIALGGHRRIHFVGIAGAGMSSLACYLVARGYAVSGSDGYPGTVGDTLRGLGATVHEGHHADFIESADLVVISSAIRADNPEVVAARGHGVPVVKRAELLGAIMNPHYGIAVAGTHGKSTTSAIIAHLLTVANLDPSVLIGAPSRALGSNARVGSSELVVVEADEYDASFHQLKPSIGVILNVEAEHLDFYGTEAEVFSAFRQFADSVSELLVICADDRSARDAARSARTSIVTYGIDSGDWRARDVHSHLDGTRFEAVRGAECIPMFSQLLGLHNVRNALAAVAVARYLGISVDVVADGLASFAGVQRRLEIRGEFEGAIVVDDYSHHPTEMAAALEALRRRYPDRRLLLVFQPHTYSRTFAFFEGFARGLCAADRTYVMDIYAAREIDTLGMHSRDLAAAAERQGAATRYTGTHIATIEAVRRDVQAGDVLVTMGAGDVFGVADDLLAAQVIPA